MRVTWNTRLGQKYPPSTNPLSGAPPRPSRPWFAAAGRGVEKTKPPPPANDVIGGLRWGLIQNSSDSGRDAAYTQDYAPTINSRSVSNDFEVLTSSRGEMSIYWRKNVTIFFQKELQVGFRPTK